MDPDLSAWGHLAPVQAFQPGELRVLQGMLDRGLQSPWTSSAGRLFDAVSALLGLCQCNQYEGQAAVHLEACLDGARPLGQPVPFRLHEGDVVEVDWAPLLRALLDGIREGQPRRRLSATFHLALAGAIVSVARRFGQERVLLTGGCFQNQNLTELSVDLLRQEGFEPFWHRNVPPNDGGLAAGQLYAVLCRCRISEHD
jgi:hydrogenase maturation protein HypF